MTLVAVHLALLFFPACTHDCSLCRFKQHDLEHYKHAASRIEEPDIEHAHCEDVASAPPPLTVLSGPPAEYYNLPLEEAIHVALQNAKVMRDLGGLVVRSPATARTIHDPAIVETDPRFGIEAALSAFDAQFSTRAFFEKNDRALNNVFFGGGTTLLEQDLASFSTQLRKRAATGTELTVRHTADYDANNAPGNTFPSAWNINYEIEARHPLLQGAGADFNRIHGPSQQPGISSGVLIARVNTDISLADFEAGVRDLVSDVENAYWDLYFAYRDLDAKIAARNQALETWRTIEARYRAERTGGEAAEEAQAREQYFRFEEEVQNALGGRLLEGTHTHSGSTGGTLRGNGGVLVAERRLRLIMGVPVSDGRLLRPADEPVMARVVFDWSQVVPEALARRVELRRQKWVIQRRELELTAARNFLLPRLDGVGRYRWRGFGRDLIDPDRSDESPFDSAFKNLTSGDFQEWQLGFEMSLPLGFRQAHVTVRNAQIQLARERAVLESQEREIIHDLSNSVADLERAYTVAQTNYNRRMAVKQQLAALKAAYDDAGKLPPLDVKLDAQRRLTDAEIAYYRSIVEYAIALKNVHLEKGSLLDYNEIFLAEGPWPGKAYDDAAQRQRRRGRAWPVLDYVLKRRTLVSRGEVPQQTTPPINLDALAPPPEEVIPLPGSPPGVDGAPPPSPEVPPLPAPELPPGAAPRVFVPETPPPQSQDRTAQPGGAPRRQ
jgi:outer membrane protein TolC